MAQTFFYTSLYTKIIAAFIGIFEFIHGQVILHNSEKNEFQAFHPKKRFLKLSKQMATNVDIVFCH